MNRTLFRRGLDDRQLLACFEQLVQYCSRPQVIHHLLAAPVTAKEFRARMREARERLDIHAPMARGKVKNYVRIVDGLHRRYHVSVLLGLSVRVDLLGAIAQGDHLDLMLEVYGRYLWQTSARSAFEADVLFEDYLTVMQALADGKIRVRACAVCGAHYVTLVGQEQDCPFCRLHDHLPYSDHQVVRTLMAGRSRVA